MNWESIKELVHVVTTLSTFYKISTFSSEHVRLEISIQFSRRTHLLEIIELDNHMKCDIPTSSAQRSDILKSSCEGKSGVPQDIQAEEMI